MAGGLDLSEFLGEDVAPAPKSRAPAVNSNVAVLQKENKRLKDELAACSSSKAPSKQDWKQAQDELINLRHQVQKAQVSMATTGKSLNDTLRKNQQEFDDAKEELQSKVNQLGAIRKDLEKNEALLAPRLEAQREKNLRRQLRIANRLNDEVVMQRALDMNIADEMKKAITGFVLEKVDQRRARNQTRLVLVDDENKLLRWGAPPGPLSNNCTHLNLQHVIRIEYGRGSRAWALYQNVPMWLCFSLYTTDRSFDFICPDDESVQCMLLSISRICKNAVGRIARRGQFLALKGWIKLQSSCAKNGYTLAEGLAGAAKEVNDAEDSLSDLKSPASGARKDNPFTFIGGGNTFIDEGEEGTVNPFTFVGERSEGLPRISKRRSTVGKRRKSGGIARK